MSDLSKSRPAFDLAKEAIIHVLHAIADDPRKFWLMGDMTGSYEKLTTAAAALWGKPVEEIKAEFRPGKEEWSAYLEKREADERLLEYLQCTHDYTTLRALSRTRNHSEEP